LPTGILELVSRTELALFQRLRRSQHCDELLRDAAFNNFVV
jgi:hypothetical protein